MTKKAKPKLFGRKKTSAPTGDKQQSSPPNSSSDSTDVEAPPASKTNQKNSQQATTTTKGKVKAGSQQQAKARVQEGKKSTPQPHTPKPSAISNYADADNDQADDHIHPPAIDVDEVQPLGEDIALRGGRTTKDDSSLVPFSELLARKTNTAEEDS